MNIANRVDKAFIVSVLPSVSIANSRRSTSSSVVPAPLVGILERALEALCSIPARWARSKLKLDEQSRHRLHQL